MATKTKMETKDLPLTDQQVDKLNRLGALATAAQQRLNEYLTAICDAHSMEGAWVSGEIKDNVLKMSKNGKV